MATSMDRILNGIGLGNLVPTFNREKITTDIVSKLSVYEFQCLGITDRGLMMKLRTECVKYGSGQPPLINQEGNPPMFDIPRDTLEALIETGFKISEIAALLAVSEATIFRRMRQYSLSTINFTDIDDDSLKATVRQLVTDYPRYGEGLLRQLLQQKNIKVSRSRFRDCLVDIDEHGIRERHRGRLHRRVYNVDGPNWLWHIDTNHKLIRWNFIIAGGVDGFSRYVTYLKCLSNNRADSILCCFQDAVRNYGLPLKVRSDKGMENIKVAEYMLTSRGTESRCMITGKSTHNQRVERLWRDVYEGVLSYYYDLFYYLEDQGYLDIMNNAHILALHHVFMQKINERLEIWRQAWVKHRIRTVGSSPARLFTAGILNQSSRFPSAQTTGDVEDNSTTDLEIDMSENPRPVVNAPTLNISEECRHNLEVECPQDWTSLNYGIDVYSRAVEIIESTLS